MRNILNESGKARLFMATVMYVLFTIDGTILLGGLYKALMKYLGSPVTNDIYSYVFVCLLTPVYFKVAKMQLQLYREQQAEKKKPSQ